MAKQIARIVFNREAVNGLTRTQGTKVFVGGQQLSGVYRIELVGEVDDVWRARIWCHAQVQTDLLSEFVVTRPSLWRRIVGWVRGWTNIQREGSWRDESQTWDKSPDRRFGWWERMIFWVLRGLRRVP